MPPAAAAAGTVGGPKWPLDESCVQVRTRLFYSGCVREIRAEVRDTACSLPRLCPAKAAGRIPVPT
jgi:hypothetical protein